MFDLEQAIREWRRDLAAHGVQSPDALDELESHLRDEIEAQMESGANTEQAWSSASRQIGQPAELRNEFARAEGIADALRQMGRTLFNLAGFAGLNQTTLAIMSTTSAIIRSRRATYLEAALFMFPSVAAVVFFNLFLLPKLQQIRMTAGLMLPTITQILAFLSYHATPVCLSLIALLVLLEWRSTQWPRYRRMALGSVVVLFNTAALFITTSAIITLIVALPRLAHLAN
jgi:hypothetical protein